MLRLLSQGIRTEYQQLAVSSERMFLLVHTQSGLVAVDTKCVNQTRHEGGESLLTVVFRNAATHLAVAFQL